MKTLLVGLAILPFLAGVTMGGQPVPLSEVQLDKITGGNIAIPPLTEPTSVVVQLYKNMVIPPHDHQPTAMYAFR
jgi:hypothetical protein